MSTAVKITREGIEVNEVPSDLSNLEAKVEQNRLDIAENKARNDAQDGILGVNGDKISVLQGNVATNAERLGDLEAVEAAVDALKAVAGSSGTTIDSINNAITALQTASASNAATIVALNDALDELKTINVAGAEAAILTLEDLVGGVQVTTLATQSSVDDSLALKVDVSGKYEPALAIYSLRSYLRSSTKCGLSRYS